MYNHFTYSEFDSPDKIGSGRMMNKEFMEKLDKARDIADARYPGLVFIITSGYRTEHYNDVVLIHRGYKASKTSAHKKGRAADILCTNDADRWAIVECLMQAGFNRIGIDDSFIHVDDDPSKNKFRRWVYQDNPSVVMSILFTRRTEI